MKEKPLTESGCVVVCGGKSCKKAGSGKLRKALEKAAEDAGAKVMVLKTKCLGVCGKGPVAVAWPKGVSFTEATPEDAVEILTAAGVPMKKKKEKARPEKREKKVKAVKEEVKAAKEVKTKVEKKPKEKPVRTKKEPKVKAVKSKPKKTDKIAPPKGESMVPEAHGYAE